MEVRLASYIEYQNSKFETEQSAADFVYHTRMQQEHLYVQ